MAFFFLSQALALIAAVAAIPLNQDSQVNATTTTTAVASHSLPTSDHLAFPKENSLVLSVPPVATETVHVVSVPPPTAQIVNNTNPDIEYESSIEMSVIPTNPGASGDGDHLSTLTDSTTQGFVDGEDSLLIEIYNSKSNYIPLVFSTGYSHPQPFVDGDSSGIAAGEYLNVWVEPGYEGMIALERAEGSKIESSYSWSSQFVPHADVSYVDGFSHEIVCSCGGVPMTGCNKDLWQYGNCPAMSGDGTTCFNPSRKYKYGPADDFFAPCQGSAYTFPGDDKADHGCPGQGKISCCIGPYCNAPGNQLGDY